MDSIPRIFALKIFTHNFNPRSNSGPNKFTRQLFNNLKCNNGVSIVDKQQIADVEFCLIQQQVHKVKPMVLRLDGIWFNSEQDYSNQNKPILFAYQNADAVVFQSNFNKRLTEHWFGKHEKPYVIHNAADNSLIEKIPKYHNKMINDNYSEIWVSASHWRPHKRLRENIIYFLEHAPKDAGMMIAGKVDSLEVFSDFNDSRLMYVGELNWESLISICKMATTFVHLAYLDHCPNVVVDAQACDCKIICSSTGGTSEIVKNGIVVNEEDWNFKPIKLYAPPKVKYDNIKNISLENQHYNIDDCSNLYYSVIKDVVR